MQYVCALARRTVISAAMLLGTLPVVAAAATQSYLQRPEVSAYLDTLVSEHGFSRDWLQQTFSNAQHRADIIERISRPAEKVWTWARYKKHLVDDARVTQGVAFWQAHADTLQRAAEQFGVAPEMVVSILGIETRYGQVTGSFSVLDALTTLGFDYPPRAKFFRKELTEFLLLAREEGKNPAALTGSYAGAMGYGQFIPSSYRHYAVDFNGDGVRDIWQDPVDAIGSVANYFARHKWRGDYPAAMAVKLSADQVQLQALAKNSLQLGQTVGELRQLGLEVEGLPNDLKAGLYRLDGENGDEYWLGLHDFYVITRYNRSHMYALAAYQLSQAIKARKAAVSEGV